MLGSDLYLLLTRKLMNPSHQTYARSKCKFVIHQITGSLADLRTVHIDFLNSAEAIISIRLRTACISLCSIPIL